MMKIRTIVEVSSLLAHRLYVCVCVCVCMCFAQDHTPLRFFYKSYWEILVAIVNLRPNWAIVTPLRIKRDEQE